MNRMGVAAAELHEPIGASARLGVDAPGERRGGLRIAKRIEVSHGAGPPAARASRIQTS